MGAGAWIAIAAAARARRIAQVLDAFRVAGATAAERARPLEPLGLESDPELTTLARAGVLVHDTAMGGWWLDESAWIRHRDQRPPRKAVKLLLGFIAFMLALVAIGTIVVVRQERARRLPPPPAPPGAVRLP